MGRLWTLTICFVLIASPAFADGQKDIPLQDIENSRPKYMIPPDRTLPDDITNFRSLWDYCAMEDICEGYRLADDTFECKAGIKCGKFLLNLFSKPPLVSTKDDKGNSAQISGPFMATSTETCRNLSVKDVVVDVETSASLVDADLTANAEESAIKALRRWNGYLPCLSHFNGTWRMTTPKVSATLDPSSLVSSSGQPTFWGTVSGAAYLSVSINFPDSIGVNQGFAWMYAPSTIGGHTNPGDITITGSTWKGRLKLSTLSPGTYIVRVLGRNRIDRPDKLLATGKLVVSPNATCADCDDDSAFVTSVNPTSGPVGTRVTVTGSGFVQGKTGFLGSSIWNLSPDRQPLSYTVSNNGTILTFEVPKAILVPCPRGARTCLSGSIKDTPPGKYELNFYNGAGGESSPAFFTVTP
jgi:hypothetical protein